MKIIGHRGAAGLAPENTVKSIQAAVKAGADYIELDVRMTRDRKLVLSHDPNLMRTYGINLSISGHTLDDLQTICPELPTLDQALSACKSRGIILEAKEYIEPSRILAITKNYPQLEFRFASFNHHFVRALKKIDASFFCYALEHHSPFDIVNRASKMKASGIGLHYAILNPLTYFLARRKNLEIYVYWLNKEWIAKLYRVLYPSIDICTDYPQLMKKITKK